MPKTNRRLDHEEPGPTESPVLALLANGSSGHWSVTLDESTEGADDLFLQIEGPSLLLSCEVADPNILDELVAVLEASTTKPSVFLIGEANRIPLWLHWDTEHEHRIQFTIGPVSRPLLRYSIHGADILALADASRQAALDLK